MKRALVVLALLAAGCGLRPDPQPPFAVYDLDGVRPPSAPVPPRIAVSIAVSEPSAPVGLDGPEIVYRLANDEPARRRQYAFARWAAPPSRLLGRFLLARLASASAKGAVATDVGADTDVALWLDLEAFDHVVSGTNAHALVRLRATLTRRPGGTLIGQRTLEVWEPSAHTDPASGVAALSGACSKIADDLVSWIAEVAR